MSTVGTLYEAIQNQGQMGGVLRYVDANTLSYLPFNGNQIKINGAWRTIPTTGIVGLGRTGVFVAGVAGQNLAAGTRYFVYAFMNGSVITADYSTTTHATSLTPGNAGVEIKSGDDTRTLIGMVGTRVGTSDFIDIPAQRWVRSWANRDGQKRDLNYHLASQWGTVSASPVLTSIAVFFLKWEHETVNVSHQGLGFNNTAAWQDYSRFQWTGNAGIRSSLTDFNNPQNYYHPMFMSESAGGSDAGALETFNNCTFVVWTSGGGFLGASTTDISGYIDD